MPFLYGKGPSVESENRGGAFLKRKSTAFYFSAHSPKKQEEKACGRFYLKLYDLIILRKIGIESQVIINSQNYFIFFVKLNKIDERGLTIEIAETIMRIYFINTIYNYIYK